MTDTDTTEQTTTADDSTAVSTDGTSPVSDGGSGTNTAHEDAAGSDRTASASASSRLINVVQWAAFGILCLLALVATFQFYFNVTEAIRVWFSPDFVPIFRAVFNLVVLIGSAIGISVLVRRLR